MTGDGQVTAHQITPGLDILPALLNAYCSTAPIGAHKHYIRYGPLIMIMMAATNVNNFSPSFRL